MRRGSFVGPIVLILIGVLFLVNNLNPDLPIMRLVGDYWPIVMIGWGLIRVIEITAWRASGRPLPAAGISGGEWFFIVILCLAGTGMFYGHKYRDRWLDSRIKVGGLEVFGDAFDYTLAEQKVAAGKTPRILVENMRGNARIVGGDTEEVKVNGRTQIRAFSQSDADKVNQDCKLEVVKQGALLVIRTNHDRVGGASRITSDLEITVPRGATVEGRGRRGDFEISELTGSASVDSENAGVRLSNIAGDVKVETRRGDIIRAANVKGNVELRGGGNDIDLDSIGGQTIINGNFSGELSFRKLARPIRVEMQNTEFRAERIPGQFTNRRGDITGSDVVGPIVIKAKSKDVQLNDFSSSLEIQVERGDLDVQPTKLPLSKLDLRTRAGNIDFSVPAAASFDLKASADRGTVENDYGDPLKEVKANHGGKIEGRAGTGGPEITLHSDRGKITVRKGSHAGPIPPAPPAPPSIPKAPIATKPPSVTSL